MKKLLYFLVLTVLLVSCEFYEPDFEGVESYQMESFENNELHMLLRLKIGNENRFNLKVMPSSMNLTVEGKDIGIVYLDKKIKIKKKTTGIYDAKIRLKLSDGALFVLPGLMNKDQVNLTFEGKVKGKVFIFGKKIDIKGNRYVNPKNFQFNFFQ